MNNNVVTHRTIDRMSGGVVYLLVKKLDPAAVIPQYHSDEAAGLDLVSVEDVIIPAREWRMIATGIAIELPAGYVGLINPRSGTACKGGLGIINSPGTVDSDYRGPISIGLINFNPFSREVKKGERIAQLVVLPIPYVQVHQVEELSDTARGAGGFGSTGATTCQ